MKYKLSIIGKGFGWELAPYDVESWGATQLNLRRPVNMVVDMNDYSNDRWGKDESLEAKISRARAKAFEIPYIDLSNYPYLEVVESLGTDYFTNTIDFMLALAIFKGKKEINMYGVNMSHETEYASQKPGVDFWCGYAKGRGIKIKVHGNSAIMRSPDDLVYGYYIRRNYDF